MEGLPLRREGVHRPQPHCQGVARLAGVRIRAGGVAGAPLEARLRRDQRIYRPLDAAAQAPQFPIGVTVTAFPLIHSIRAPAVGLRIRAGRAIVFYAPDVLGIEDREAALAGIDLYIGDGASLRRDLVRKHEDKVFGHIFVLRQLSWCAEAGVRKAVFTHCGSGIVRDHEAAAGFVEASGRALGVEASIATDGQVMKVRS